MNSRLIALTLMLTINAQAADVAGGKFTPPDCSKIVEAPAKERSAVIEKQLDLLEEEYAKNPAMLKTDSGRDLLGTFLAGRIPSTTPFVSVDRECWALFHEAKEALAEGNSLQANASGKTWRTCLSARDPQRFELAKPTFSCFTPAETAPKSKRK